MGDKYRADESKDLRGVYIGKRVEIDDVGGRVGRQKISRNMIILIRT